MEKNNNPVEQKEQEDYWNNPDNFYPYLDFPPDGYFTNDEARLEAEQNEK